MPKTIEAIYEDGVFKPIQKIDMKEHERVEIKIHRNILPELEKPLKKDFSKSSSPNQS